VRRPGLQTRRDRARGSTFDARWTTALVRTLSPPCLIGIRQRKHYPQRLGPAQRKQRNWSRRWGRLRTTSRTVNCDYGDRLLLVCGKDRALISLRGDCCTGTISITRPTNTARASPNRRHGGDWGHIQAYASEETAAITIWKQRRTRRTRMAARDANRMPHRDPGKSRQTWRIHSGRAQPVPGIGQFRGVGRRRLRPLTG
jgi:hypothetical protein